jgi:hypothetical protein
MQENDNKRSVLLDIWGRTSSHNYIPDPYIKTEQQRYKMCEYDLKNLDFSKNYGDDGPFAKPNLRHRNVNNENKHH